MGEPWLPHSRQRRVCHNSAGNSVPDICSEYCAELLVFSFLPASREEQATS